MSNHGSYAEIKSVDLSMCDNAKDFGKGFYLTTSKRQAKSFIPTSMAKAIRRGYIPYNQSHGFVTAFRVHVNINIKYYEFESANKDWLYYIAINRRKHLARILKTLLSQNFEEYEVLVGKIANDDTNVTLSAFLAGTYGDVGSDLAYDIVTKLLKPERLENQICFKSNTSIKMLEKIGFDRYEFR